MLRRIFTRGEESDDLAHGQIVIVTARWILVAAGLLLAMWNPGSLGELRVELFVILGLAVVNFYLHAHLLVRRQTLEVVAYAASAVDLAVVTLLVAVQGGEPSNLYIFYFPAILGLSVAFPTALTLFYAGSAGAAYGTIALATATGNAEAQSVVARLLVLAAVAFCGNLYWRIERDRRSRVPEPAALPLDGLRERGRLMDAM